MRSSLKLFLIALLVLPVSSAHAEDIAALEAAVADGNAAAMTELAALYQRGEGVEKDPARAIALYRRAAELGEAEAQFNLGNIFLLGEGVEVDEAWALTYYRQAASQGHELALRNMNQLYRAAGIDAPALAEPAAGEPDELVREHSSSEPEVDRVAAVAVEPLAPTTRVAGAATTTPAASAPAPTEKAEPTPTAPATVLKAEVAPPATSSTRTSGLSADEREAIRLAETHGVAVDLAEQDQTQGLAEEPSAPVRTEVETVPAVIDEPDMDRAANAAGDQVAVSPPGEGGTEHYVQAQRQLAGEGMAVDVPGGIESLRRAADAGHAQAQFDLGQRYLIGAGVEPDDAMAITLFRNAARQGHAEATARVRAIYADAGIAPPDLARPRQQLVPRAEASVDEPAETAVSSASAASEPYDYVVVDHSTPAPQVRVEEINPPPPANHVVVSGGALAQSQPVPPAASMSENGLSASEMTAEPDLEAGLQGAVSEPGVGDDASADGEAARVAAAALLVEQAQAADEARQASTARLAEERQRAEAARLAEEARQAEAARLAEETRQAEAARLAEEARQAEAARLAEEARQAEAARLAEEKRQAEAVRLAEAAASQDHADRADSDAAPAAGAGFFAQVREAQLDNQDDNAVVISRAPGSSPSPSSLAPASVSGGAEPLPMPTIAAAKAALNAGDLANAAQMFTRLAEAGDAEAQAHIGYMSYQGEGVARDKAVAVEWYRRSAVQGNRDAQYNLAVAYAFGEGVPQNDAEAVTWYRRAAEQGSAIAQYSLGVSYALGEGVAQSDADAARWYRAAAEQGYPAAQYNLAYMYRAGSGLEQSDSEALRWFLQAAQNGHPSAQYSLGYMYRSGKGVARNMDEAIRWYRLAAAQGHAEARADLASLVP